MTGQTHASRRVKCDLLLQCCKTKYLEKQVKQIVAKSATFAEVLVALERQYPSYETDLSIRTDIQNLNRSQVAQDTAQEQQHTERAHR